jgi:acetone carboxylase gamma subunit
MSHYDPSEIERLIDGELPWTRVQEIMKDAKDVDRFDKWVAILQKRVPWKEKILLPLTTALFIVRKGKQRIVKCRCGHEFGDYRVNWKLESLIHVRETEEQLREVYRGTEQPDPSWIQIREYTCPGCGTQLEVEAVPRGCPPDFELLPDLDTFYRDWLGRPLPDEVEFADKTLDAVRNWRTDSR